MQILDTLYAILLVAVPLSLGWYIMWKMYISKYEFVRELLGHKKEVKEKPKSRRVTNVELLTMNKLIEDIIFNVNVNSRNIVSKT